MARYGLAVLGGTFDHLHVGHHALLATAFRVGDTVAIGLTSDRFLAGHPKPDGARIQAYDVRRAALTRWIRRNFPGRKWTVVPLEDTFGRSVEPEVDVLVVSRETLRGGRSVNRERRRLGRPPVPLVVVPLALADDLEPVSSRRVRAGMIGTEGQRFTPLRVTVAVGDSRDLGPARSAVRRVFPQARLLPYVVGRRRGVPSTEFLVRVARRRPTGWNVTARTPHLRLGPRRVDGSGPADLERGVLFLLRPQQERKLFGTRRS